MEQKHKGLLIGIAFGATITGLLIWQIVSIPKNVEEARQQIKNSNRLGLTNGAVVGNVNIPPTGDAGKFMGKLEQLDFVSADLPSAYGTYVNDQYASHGYLKQYALAPEDSDSTQFYSAGITNQDNAAIAAGGKIVTEARAGLMIRTFDNTSAAAHYYAINQTIDGGFREPANQNFAGYNRNTRYYSIPGLGANNIVTKTWDDPKDPNDTQFVTRDWSITVLLSNATITFRITLPYAATDKDVETIMKNWLKHVDAYQPGTASDVAAENASGS